MKRIHLVLIIAYLFSDLFCSSASWGQTKSKAALTKEAASIEGNVVDATTKQPIVGATVQAKNQAGKLSAPQRTGANGAYHLSLDDAKQTYLLIASADGYEPLEERVAFTTAYNTQLFGKALRLYRVGTKPISTSTAAKTLMAKALHPTDSITSGDGLFAVLGVVVGSDNNMMIKTATVQIRSLQGSVLAQTKTDYQGTFAYSFHFRVDPSKLYRITTKADGYEPYDESLDLTSVNTRQTFSKIIRIFLRPIVTKTPVQQNATVAASTPPAASTLTGRELAPPKTLDAKVVYTPPLIVAPAGRTTQLRAIQFVQSKADLLPDAQPALEQLLTFMRDKPTVEIELAGHTDNQGDFDENLRLSKQRVEVVKAYLVQNGIAAGRITTRGYGPTRPLASNNNEGTRQQNRRVEMKVLKE